MTRSIIASMIVAGVCACSGCGTATAPERSGAGGAAQISVPPSITLQNYSQVEAVLESAETYADPQYRMKLFIVAVTAKAGSSAVIEPGQRVVATPLYEMDAAGGVDLTIPKNQELYAIRSLVPGTKFAGTLAVTSKGAWHLLSVTKK